MDVVYFAGYGRMLASKEVNAAASADGLPSVPGASCKVGWVPGSLRFVERDDRHDGAECIFDPRRRPELQAAAEAAAAAASAPAAEVRAAVSAAAVSSTGASAAGGAVVGSTSSASATAPAHAGAGAASTAPATAQAGGRAEQPKPPFDPAAAELPTAPPFGVLIRAYPMSREQLTAVIKSVSNTTARYDELDGVVERLIGQRIGSSEPLPGAEGKYARLLLVAKVDGKCAVTVTADHARLDAATGDGPRLALARPTVDQAVELFRGLKECRFDPGTAARYINERAFKAGGWDEKTQLTKRQTEIDGQLGDAAAGGAAAGGAGAAAADGGAKGGAGAAPEAPPAAAAAAVGFAAMPVEWAAFQRE